jgi:hypothetical protein
MGENKHYGSDFGTLKPSDFGVGFIKLCHGQSREAKKGANGEPPIAIGEMFISRNRQVLPVGTQFIPLLRTVNYIKWAGRPGEGRMEFSTSDENDPRIAKISGLTFTQDPRTGETKPPLVTQYVNFYCLVNGYADEPLILSFYRTSAPIGRRLTQDTFKASKCGHIPLRALLYQFGAPTVKREKGQEWVQFNPLPCGFAPAAAEERINKMYDFAESLKQASTGAEFQSLREEEDNTETAPEKGAVAVDTGARLIDAVVAPAAPTAPAVAAPPVPAPVPMTPQPAAPAVSIW